MDNVVARHKTLPQALLWMTGALAIAALGVVMGYSVTVGLGIVAVLGLTSLIWSRPEIGVYLSLVAIPFDRLGKISPDSGITAAKIFVTLTVCVWVAKAIVKRDRGVLESITSSPLTVLAFLFLFFSFVSLVNASNLPFGMSQFTRRVSQVIFFFLLVDVLFDREVLWRSIGFYVVGSFVASWAGIYELWTGQSVLSAAEIRNVQVFNLQAAGVRIKGPQGDSGFHAIAMVLPALLSVFLMTQTRSWALRLALGLAVFLFLINIVGTASRAGAGALVIALIIFWFYRPFRRKGLVLVLTIAVIMTSFSIAFALNPDVFAERLVGVGGGDTVKWRLAFADMSFQMIRDHPLFGIGTAQFPIVYYRYAVPSAPAKAMFTHNSFLQTWTENGPLGLVVYLVMYLTLLRYLYRIMKATPHGRARDLALTAFAGVVGLAFFAATTQVLEMEIYWMLFAWSVVSYRLFLRERESPAEVLSAQEAPAA